MLTQDLYSAISNIAASIDAMLESQDEKTSNTVDALCDSIDKLCKTVTDGKGAAGAETVLGLIAGALTGETDKIEKGAAMLAKSVSSVSASLDEISKTSGNIVGTTKNVSESMQYLSEGIESIGVRTLFSAYIAKVAFPAISAFTINAVELFSSIAEKEKEMKASRASISILSANIDDLTHAAGMAVLGGIASVAGLVALVPLAAYTLAASALFVLVSKLFDSKKSKETGKAISSMSKGIMYLSLSAVVAAISAPFVKDGIIALVPLTLFVIGVGAVNMIVNAMFGGKKGKNDNISAIKNMAKGILYMSLAAMATIVTAPVALIAIPCALILGMFTLTVGALVVKPVMKLTSSKDFKGFTKGVFAMAGGILIMGVVALASIVLTPVMLLGSLGMLSTGMFVNVSGKVFKRAAKNTKDYIKGTVGLLVMAAGVLATTYLMVQTVKVGKDLLAWDTLGVFGIVAAAAYGGTKLLSVSSKVLGSVVKGAAAVMLVAGTVYGAAWCFNNAVTECKGLLSNPEETITSLLALIGSVATMGAAIAAAGVALPFIIPGAAAVALVSGTVFAASKAISSASEAWAASQESGAFELDSDSASPFSRTVKGLVSSMIDAVSDIDDIDKLGDAIKAIMPVSDFVQKLAVGVSEFSKIAMMKGEIADSTGKKMPFNLTKVGEGIGAIIESVVTGISSAMKTFSFEEKDMVEISTGGFMGFGTTKTKIPKQIAAISHLMPLATFIGSLASGVSEFSKIATMQGEISVYDEEKKTMVKRPFNLADVGKGISAIIESLMVGISEGMAVFEEGGMTEITSGGLFGLGGDKIQVPTRLVNLQHIMPLASFISSCAEMISTLGKDKDGNTLSVDSDIIGGIFTSLVNAISVDGIDDILEDAGGGLESFVDPLKAFCNVGWKNLPDNEGVASFTNLIDYCAKIDAAKAINISTGASAITSLASALSSDTSITGDNVEATASGIEKTIDAINDLDIKKARALSDVYESMAKAASKKSSALKEVVKAIKESTETLVGAVDHIDASTSTTASNTTINNNQYAAQQQSNTKQQNESQHAATVAKQKVTVDLVINGQSGDQWIIRRK